MNEISKNNSIKVNHEEVCLDPANYNITAFSILNFYFKKYRWTYFNNVIYYYNVADKSQKHWVELNEDIFYTQIRERLTLDSVRFGGKLSNRFTKDVAETVKTIIRAKSLTYQCDTWITKETEEKNKQNWLNCQNGLLNLDTQILHPHSSDFFSISSLPNNYIKDGIKDKRYSKFYEEWLSEVFSKRSEEDRKELIQAIQMYFGYILIPEISSQSILWLRGTSGSGKSTLIKILRSLLGSDSVPEESPESLLKESTRNCLLTAKVISVDEISKNTPVNITGPFINVIKQISGGGQIKFNPKGLKTFSAYITGKIILSSETGFNVPSSDGGFTRRLIVIPFNKKLGGGIVDHNVGKRLETDEIESIFAWAVEGYKMFKNNKQQIPLPRLSKKAIEAIKEYDSGDIKSFFSEYIEITNDNNDYISTTECLTIFRDLQMKGDFSEKISSRLFQTEFKSICEVNGLDYSRKDFKGKRTRGFLGAKIRERIEAEVNTDKALGGSWENEDVDLD